VFRVLELPGQRPERPRPVPGTGPVRRRPGRRIALCRNPVTARRVPARRAVPPGRVSCLAL